MDLARLFVYILLIPFILMNIMISATGFFFSTVGKLIAKLFKPQIPKMKKEVMKFSLQLHGYWLESML